MKLSVVISVFESYEIVRRQLLHFKKMNLPFELIIVDDGSNPPIEGATIRTNSKIRWNVGAARNMGAKIAKGEYLFMTDIDHIISKEAMEDALNFTGNKMIFRRQIGVLDEDGNVIQDPEVLKEWGWTGKYDASVHGNTWVMKKSIFEELGGFRTHLTGKHPKPQCGEDSYFNREWGRKFRGHKPKFGRDIYHFPISRFNINRDLNPKGLFYDAKAYDCEEDIDGS